MIEQRSDTPTPETDVVTVEFALSSSPNYEGPLSWVEANIARKLERERDQLRAKLAEFDGLLSKKPCQHEHCVTYNKMCSQVVSLRAGLAASDASLNEYIKKCKALEAENESLRKGIYTQEGLDSAKRWADHISSKLKVE